MNDCSSIQGFSPCEPSGADLLKTVKLSCMRGDRWLFEDLSVEVEAGTCLLVQGDNGIGKTSLLRMLVGLTPPAKGEIRWNGTLIDEIQYEYRSNLLYYGHLQALKDELTAEENLVSAAAITGRPVAVDTVRAALAKAGLAKRDGIPVRMLSQGQRRRASLARLMWDQSPLWVLDEPLTALDARGIQWLCGVMDGHLARGGLVVVTSHQAIPLSSKVRSMRLGT